MPKSHPVATTKDETLKAYRGKRDFRGTPEPRGGKKPKDGPHFVVQKHAARQVHYDFRLEVEGVLKSWAVPKGPSMNPAEKRLAVPVEDHPLEYAKFEGVIPEGNYGAGTVIVWDAGSFRNLNQKDGESVPMEQALRDGHADFWLEGKKLRGGFALIQTRPRVTRRREWWLLVKKNDSEADAKRNPVRDEPTSVISGLTMEELREKETKRHIENFLR